MTALVLAACARVPPRSFDPVGRPGQRDLALWSAETGLRIDLAGVPQALGAKTVLVDAVVGRLADCSSWVDPLILVGREWRPVPWPLDPELDLVVTADDAGTHAVATVGSTGPPLGVTRILVWSEWSVDGVELDGAPTPYVRAQTEVLVGVPPGVRATVTVHLTAAHPGPAQLLAADRVNLLAVAFPWAPWTRTSVHVPSAGGLEWVDADRVHPEGDGVSATWDEHAPTWVLSGSVGSITTLVGPISLTTPPALLSEHDRVLERAAVTLDALRARGLPTPDHLQIAVGPQRFSFAGPPVVLAEGDVTDPHEAFVVGHEIGHGAFPPHGWGTVSEAVATWVSGWLDDPDGARSRRWWTPTRGTSRCPLLLAQNPGDGAGLLLAALADRMGEDALIAAVQARDDDSWAALSERLPPDQRDWLLPWLLAPRWPTLVASVHDGRLAIVDLGQTGVRGTVEVEKNPPDGSRLRVDFGPGAESVPLPDGWTTLTLDPDVRLPVVVPRP